MSITIGRSVNALLLACLTAICALFAQPAVANDTAEALAQLAALETTVLECYRAKEAATAAGIPSSRIRCFKEGSSSIFVPYRRSLRRLGLLNPTTRSALGELVSAVYACRAVVDGARPSLQDQESCGIATFNIFELILDPNPQPDTEPPIITIATPVDGAELDSQNVVVSGSVTDNQSAISRVAVNGVELNLQADEFSTVLTLVEGANSVTVSATDSAANTAERTITVTFRTPIPGEDPEQIVELNALEAQVLDCLTAINVAESTGQTSTCFKSNGSSIYADYRRTLRRLGLFDAPTRTAYVKLRNDVSACYARTASARPPLAAQQGCTRIAFDAFAAVVNPGGGGNSDTQPPTVTITQPTNGEVVTSTTITVTGTATDSESAIASVLVNGVAASVSNDTYTANVELSAQGNVAILALATDTAGNSSSVQSSVLLDSIAPEITVLSPAADTATTSNSIEVRAQFIDNGTGITQAAINGESLPVGGPVPGITFARTVSLNPGVNLIPLTSVDAAGNTATGSFAIVSDATAPVITVTSPTDGAVVGSNRITLTGNSTDPESGITSVTVNGIAADLTSDQFNAFVDLVAGSNPITVIATNQAGLTTALTLSVTFNESNDSTAPSVTDIYPLAEAADAVLNSRIIVRFSEPLSADSVTTDNFTLAANGATLPGTTALSQDGLSAVFRPSTQLPADQRSNYGRERPGRKLPCYGVYFQLHHRQQH